MMLRLQGYNFTPNHVTSDQNISDYTSRHPQKNENASNYIESYVSMVTKFAHQKRSKSRV